MQPEQKGVMVRAVSPVADAARHLQPDDVIMRFDGVQVASDGTVPFRCALHAAEKRFRVSGITRFRGFRTNDDHTRCGVVYMVFGQMVLHIPS